jgi:serine phosphatase RsbU (regulator of sigma subunit)/anti-sigma regulatory factor (Ser/Thr protein kinase)
MVSSRAIPAATLSIEVRCDLQSVREACDMARQFLAESGLDEDEMNAWELILAEAANNAVQKAKPEARSLSIRIELVVEESQVVTRVTDHTIGFELPEKAVLPPPDSESGRGLFLMQNFTDEIQYLRGRGENCLVLRRHRGHPMPVADMRLELSETRKTLDQMTEELASSFESLAAIFRFSSELHNEPSAKFTERWLRQLLETTNADWFVLRLVDGAGALLSVASSSRLGWSAPPLPLGGTLAPGAPVELHAAMQRRDIWFDAITPLNASDPILELSSHPTGLAHPLLVNETLVGVISVGRHNVESQFQAAHVNIIQTFGDFLAIQIRNAQYQEEQLQARLATKELEIAADIERSLLPVSLPQPVGFHIAGYYRSARQVGGDFYDVIDAGPSKHLLAVADVMGKGLPAAIFATIFRSLLRSRPELMDKPGEFLGWLNQNLVADLARVDMFITAQLVLVDFTRGELVMAGAGHPPLLVATADGQVTEMPGDGPPLGIFLERQYGESRVRMAPGGRLLLYTDGLTEARSPDGQFFGLAALKEWLGSSARSQELVEVAKRSLVVRLEHYEQMEYPADDQTFLLVAADAGPA